MSKEPIKTASEDLLRKVVSEVSQLGTSMYHMLEGRLIAHQGGSLTFRTIDNRPGQGEEQFGAYVDLWDGMTPPVAIVWPQRTSGSVATGTFQARHLAVAVKLATGFRYGVVEAGRPLEWLPETHPRVFPIKRCIMQHRKEEQDAVL